ncbi:MAG: RNA polymerase sigma factor [Limisphaerales bacterium]
MSDHANTDALDKEDMTRLVQGHSAALNDLMERHAHALFCYLLRQCGNEEDANDIAQEAFVRVYQHCKQYSFKSKFSSWLYTIATNQMRTRMRSQYRHPTVSLDGENENGASALQSIPSETASPSDTALADERAATIRAAINALPEKLRSPLILFEYHDKSHAEIAEILGCSAKAVEMKLYHARTRLKDDLAQLLK